MVCLNIAVGAINTLGTPVAPTMGAAKGHQSRRVARVCQFLLVSWLLGEEGRFPAIRTFTDSFLS